MSLYRAGPVSIPTRIAWVSAEKQRLQERQRLDDLLNISSWMRMVDGKQDNERFATLPSR